MALLKRISICFSGFSKTWYFVWLLNRYISFRGYSQTEAGKELAEALGDLKMKLERFKAGPRRFSAISSDCGKSINYKADNEPSSGPSDSPSLTISPESFTFPPDSSCFISRQRTQCKSLTSLVANETDAKEAIKKLNQQSTLEEDYYPIQNSADRSEEEREWLCSPSHVCAYHCHGFGEECRICDDDVLSNRRHSSESNDETMPKSPDAQEGDLSYNVQIDLNEDSGVYDSTLI